MPAAIKSIVKTGAKNTSKQIFKNYKHIKNADAFIKTAKNDSFLKKVGKGITAKRVAAVGLAGVAGSLSWVKVHKHVDENSGCFVIEGDKKCKVTQFSCCNAKITDDVPACTKPISFQNICDNFDDENSCCKGCDCKNYGCSSTQTMHCKRTNYGDALAHVVNPTTLLDTISNAGFKYVKYFFIVVICIIVGLLILKFK